MVMPELATGSLQRVELLHLGFAHARGKRLGNQG